MEFFTKFMIFSVLVAVACGRNVLHKRSTSNATEEETDEQDNECNCNWRYFKHYEIKGCVVEEQDSCGCPKKFSCPSNETLQAPAKVCIYRNKEYKVGSKIITSDACHVCRCYNGVPPVISCIRKECPELESAPGKDCHLVYDDSKCCPVGEECLKSAVGEEIKNETCEYDGKLYPLGSKIYPIDDPCQICMCNENWSGVDNSSCYQHDCVFEQRKSKLDAGCIPVYHESRCCPIEFYCPSNHNFSYSILPSNETENNETSFDDQCRFGDQFYEIGDELLMDNPCVTCNCSVPPDFTCVHQTCSSSPSAENCYPIYSPGQCCPSYECLFGDAESESVPDGCPTPICADSSCRIEVPPGHECPTCVCGERFSELEHNELQQQTQLINNIEELSQVYEGPREAAEDYSEDELQMMPIRIQDSEGQFSEMEKIILPEPMNVEQYLEDFRELESSSNENISSSETGTHIVTDITGETLELTEQNTTALTESEANDTTVPNLNSSEKEVQKRSDGSHAFQEQVKVASPFEQEQLFGQVEDSDTDIEREGGAEESTVDFADELESFKNKIFNKNETIINEILSINHVVEVPAGCPTPMCEGSWCKIGIPPGHNCPTCICKRHGGGEP